MHAPAFARWLHPMRLRYHDFVNTRIIKLALLAAATALLVTVIACRSSQVAQVGTEAPDFTVVNSDKTVTLSHLRGKPVVLVFWATWCPPCVEETPSLVAMQKQLGDKVTVLAVSTDEDNAAFRKFTSTRMTGVLAVRDGDHRSNTLYGTFAFPESYIIDRNGIIRRKLIGAADWTSPDMIDFLQRM